MDAIARGCNSTSTQIPIKNYESRDLSNFTQFIWIWIILKMQYNLKYQSGKVSTMIKNNKFQL